MPAISEAISEGARRLRDAAIDHDRQTAAVLLCHVLGVDRTRLLTRPNEEVESSRYLKYLALVDRRATGEPVQYIIGHQEFYGLDFTVTPAVLIPRPETEFLVEQVIKLSGESETKAGPLIVDVGTGSGCIAVALAVHLPVGRIIASDISAAALQVARQNATTHDVVDRIEFVEGDLLGPLGRLGLEAAVDFITSNPPYVAAPDLDSLQREVRDHEPGLALRGGPAGLDFYSRLLIDSLRFLKPGGCLVCEIGYGLLDAIRSMIDPESWEPAAVTKDLQGIPRALTIRRI